jgi:hypothetical protein
MRKIATTLIALILFPAFAVSAALLEGRVVKVDRDKKQIVLRTEKGQETIDYTTSTKGIDKALVGSNVKVTFSQKGEKLLANDIDASKDESKIAPSDNPAAPSKMK